MSDAHDPLLCGIDPGHRPICPACLAEAQAKAKGSWADLCQLHPVLLAPSGHPRHEPRPPEPLSDQEVARLVATLRHPRYQDLLRDTLADFLADEIAAIALAATEDHHVDNR